MGFFSSIHKRFLELVCADDGKLSLSRVSPLASLVSVIVWVSYVIYKSNPHTLPDLTGPAIFTGSGAAHYGIGKYFSAKKDDVDPDSSPKV